MILYKELNKSMGVYKVPNLRSFLISHYKILFSENTNISQSWKRYIFNIFYRERGKLVSYVAGGCLQILNLVGIIQKEILKNLVNIKYVHNVICIGFL